MKYSGFWKEPLFHFLGIGVFLFFLFPLPESNQIHIDAEMLRAYRETQAKHLGVLQLSKKQIQEVDRKLVWDELLSKEARRLGLGEKDYIIQQRLVQKMLFVAENTRTSKLPTPQELKLFYQRHPKRWFQPKRISFFHLFAKKNDPVFWIKIRQQATWHDKKKAQEVPVLGETFLLGNAVEKVSIPQLEDMYGKPFAQQLQKQAFHAWSKPLSSRFGWHIVKVHWLEASRVLAFDKVHKQVLVAYLKDQKERAKRKAIRELFSRYQVRVEGFAKDAFKP